MFQCLLGWIWGVLILGCGALLLPFEKEISAQFPPKLCVVVLRILVATGGPTSCTAIWYFVFRCLFSGVAAITSNRSKGIGEFLSPFFFMQTSSM